MNGLYHHGIKGQEWGVRNGPPYPLERSAKTRFQKKILKKAQKKVDSGKYLVDFGANIAIPEGGTVGAISLAMIVDGATIPSTNMIVTPAAVNEYFNVSRAANIPIWRNCCETLAIRNTSNQPILVENANIIFSR